MVIRSLMFCFKVLLCFVACLCFSACVPTSDSAFRCSGFRVNGNRLTQVFEDIDCSGTTYFITPEGRRTYYEYQRKGYFLGNVNSRKKISGLDDSSNYYFVPLDSSEHWLAVKEMGGYPHGAPGIGHQIEEVVILSEHNGALKTFDAISNKVIFDRRWRILYVMNRDKMIKAFKVDVSSGLQETLVSEDAKNHFEIASKLGMTFEHGLLGLSFEQIREELSIKTDTPFTRKGCPGEIPDPKSNYSLIFSDKNGCLKHALVREGDIYVSEFVYIKSGDSQLRTYRAKDVTNFYNTVVSNGKIWYCVILSNDCLDSMEVRSISL